MIPDAVRTASGEARPRMEPALPSWVGALMGIPGSGPRILDTGAPEGMIVRGFRAGAYSLTSLEVPGLTALHRDGCMDRCSLAYQHLFQLLDRWDDHHPVRLWNFIPGILEPLDGEPHRYMAFNAGRFRAFRRWREEALAKTVPTATGVGREGDTLSIHCLSAASPGTPVENPRQISAYNYSKKYGVLPPCFARATRIEEADGSARLFVGGTASVRGEDSLHEDDLRGQLAETFLNLATLISAAVDSEGGTALAMEPAPASPELGLLLSHYRELRVYHPRPEDLPVIAEAVERRFSQVTEVEYVQADLCRPELSVEIEGVAALP